MVKKKTENNWEYCVYIGQDSAGKKKYKRKSGFKTKKDCLLAAAKIKNSNNTKLQNSDLTIKNIGLLFLAEKSMCGVKLTTLDHYKSIYRNICREFTKANKNISSVKVDDISKYILYSQTKRSNNSTSRFLFVMKQIFTFAKSRKFLTKNIFDDLPSLKTVKTIPSIWTKNELEQYMPVLQKYRYYNIVFLALETGLRLGELLGLKWEYVDFVKGTLLVKQTYIRSNGVCFFSTPKSSSGYREIVLLNRSYDLLLKLYKKRQSKFVFPNHANPNNPCNPHTVTSSFRRFLDNNNLRHIRFHDLRHMHATLLLSNNINYKLISKRLGHSNISFTLQTYTHVLPENEIQQLRNISDLF